MTQNAKSQYAKYRLPIKIHKKGMGELQIHYSAPRMEQDPETRRDKTVEGAVYLELARPVAGGDGNTIDWKNKLVFKLDPLELSHIITKTRLGLFPVRRTHKSGANSTASLIIAKGRDIDKGDDAGMTTYKWSLSRGGKDAEIYLNDAEMHFVFTLFEQVSPFLLGWIWVDAVNATVERGQPLAPKAQLSPHTQQPQDYAGGSHHQGQNHAAGHTTPQRQFAPRPPR